jgi:hypothetical protein
MFSSCSSERQKTPEELRRELKLAESFEPRIYLENSDVTIRPLQKQVQKAGLFKSAKYENDGALIEGNIINKASLAKYKDIVVTVHYYSRTETIIKEEQYVLYEYIEPNSTIPFTVKVNPPAAYANFGFIITDASPVLN